MNTVDFNLRRVVSAIAKASNSARLLQAMLIAIIVLGALRMGEGRTASTSKVVEAEAFILRDPNGGKRGEFSVDKEGRTALSIYDAKGQTRLTLMSGSESAHLTIYDKAENERLQLIVDDDANHGSVSFKINDPKHIPSFHITSSNSESTWMALVDKKRKAVRLQLGTNKDGYPGVFARDEEGKERIKLRIRPDGDVSIGVGGKVDDSSTSIVSYADGRIGLEIGDGKGKTRMSQFWTQRDNIALRIRNANRFDEQISLCVLPDGTASLKIQDPTQKRAILLDASANNGPSLMMQSDGLPNASMAVERDGLPRLRLIDNDGKLTGFVGSPDN